MSVSVGGVTIEFDGDASGAKAAMQAVAEKLDVLVAKEHDLKVALDAATSSGKVSEAALGALRAAHAEATNAVKRLTGELKNEEDAERAATAATKAAAEASKAAERAQQEQARAAEKAAAEARKAAETHGVYGEKARSLDEAMGTLQTSIGGVSSAFGVQGQQMTDAVGAVADVAKAFGSGGPLLAALALAGAAVAGIGAHFAAAAEKAREAMKKIMDDAQAMSDQLQQDLDNLRQLEKEAGLKEATAGLSEEQKLTVKAFLDTADATKALRDFEARFGLMAANVSNTLAGTQEMVRDPNKVPVEVVFGYSGDPSFNKYADLLVKTYSQLQEKVKATVSSGQAQVGAAKAEAGVEAGKAAAETAIQSAYDKLIASLDANTAALEVDAELSRNEYTAEDRATREDRGVFEVSVGLFDALAEQGFVLPETPTEEQSYESTGPLILQRQSVLAAAGMKDLSVTLDSTDGRMSALGGWLDRMSSELLTASSSTKDFSGVLADRARRIEREADFSAATGRLADVVGGAMSGQGLDAGGLVGAISTAIGGPAAGQMAEKVANAVGGAMQAIVDGIVAIVGDSRFGGAMNETMASMGKAFGLALVAAVIALPAIITATIVGPFLLLLGPLIALVAIPVAVTVVALAALAAALAVVAAVLIGIPALAMGIPMFAFALSQSTESFKRFQGAMSIVVDRMVAALEPFWESLLFVVGIFDVAAQVLMPFFDAFASTMSTVLGEMFFNVLKGLLVGFSMLALGAAGLTNMFWEAVAATAKFLGAKDEEVDSILSNKVDMDELSEAVDKATELTFEQAKQIGEDNAELWDLKQKGDEVEDSMEEWDTSLTNVPSGFKAMAAIYANADAESGAGMLEPQQAMSMVINIENWNSKGDSQRDWDDLRRLARNGHKGKKAASSRSFGDEKN